MNKSLLQKQNEETIIQNNSLFNFTRVLLLFLTYIYKIKKKNETKKEQIIFLKLKKKKQGLNYITKLFSI